MVKRACLKSKNPIIFIKFQIVEQFPYKCKQIKFFQQIMEVSIEKYFLVFQDISQQPYFNLSLHQIIQILQAHPIILPKVLAISASLMHSTKKQATHRLKQRQLFSVLIERSIQILNINIQNFIKDDSNQMFNILSFKRIQYQEILGQEIPKNKSNFQKIRYGISKLKQLKIDQILNEQVLGRGLSYTSVQESQLAKDQQQFFKKLNQMQILNQKLFSVLSQEDGPQYVSKLKTQHFYQKFSSKPMQENFHLIIQNPFNVILDQALSDSLDKNWQIRHSGIMVLKAFVNSDNIWLGFKRKIKVSSWNQIKTQLTKSLLDWYTNKQYVQFVENIISKCVVIIALDKFVDFQSQKCNILVRQTANQILGLCIKKQKIFKNMPINELVLQLIQSLLIESKKLFDGKGWEIRQSVFNLLSKTSCQQLYKRFQQYYLDFLKQQEVDDVIVNICQCIIPQMLVKSQNAQKFQIRIWQLLKCSDDITFATSLLLSLSRKLRQKKNKKNNLRTTYQHIIVLHKHFQNKIKSVRIQTFQLLLSLIKSIPSSTCQLNVFKQCNNSYPIQKTLILLIQKTFTEQNQQVLEIMQTLIKQIWNLISQISKNTINNYFLNLLSYVLTTQQLVEKYFIYFEQENLRYLNYIKTQPLQSLSYISIIRSINLSSVLIFNPNNLKSQNHSIVLNQILNKNCKISETQIKTILQMNHMNAKLPQLQIFKKKINQQCKIINNIYPKLNQVCQNPLLYQEIYREVNLLNTSDKVQRKLLILIQNYQSISRKFSNVLKASVSCIYINQKIAKGLKIQNLNNVIKPLINVMINQKFSKISDLVGSTLSKILIYQAQNSIQLYKKLNRNIIISISTKYNRQKPAIKPDRGQAIRYSSKYQVIRTMLYQLSCQYPIWFKNNMSFVIQGLNKQSQFQNSLKLINICLGMKCLKACMGQWIIQIVCIFKKVFKKFQNHKLYQKILQRLLISQAQLDLQIKLVFQQIIQMFCVLIQNKCISAFKTFQNCIDKCIQKLIPHLPKFLLIIVKLLACQNQQIQSIALRTLGNLMTCQFILPVKSQASLRQIQSRKFIDILARPQAYKTQAISIVEQSGLQLRDYQKEGIKWLSFLCQYNLNGALCDQMGLGKTIQALAVLNYHHKISKNKNSLIICPPTLIYHWKSQQMKYFKDSKLNTIIYLNDQIQIQDQAIYITSYNFIKSTKSQKLKRNTFLFIILDQGHAIRNLKTQVSRACKTLVGQHRFILTGTPIQNNLLQIWSIFQFLMKGYLGDQEKFKKNYNKLFKANFVNFNQDRLLFCQQQRIKLQILHKKITPFILRRKKADVLKQIPQKIIQDFQCILTHEQQQIYRQFQNNQLIESKKQNILSIINKMRLVVNHPHLVNSQLPKSFCLSGKMIALVQILSQLGWQSPIQFKKVAIFSQQNNVLKLIGQQIIQKKFKNVKFLYLTSQLTYQNRFKICQQFNNNLSIKAILVGSKIGSHGINLSKASVVVMFDHSYNPCQDQQAMDRAHRLGQKNTLMVYRLIAKNTLQQNLMCFQRYKILLAKSLVNIDNTSINNLQQAQWAFTAIQQQKKRVVQDVGGAYNKIQQLIKVAIINPDEYNNPYN